ncbi:MAG TPA: hypothetical protein VKF63_12650 [Terracidiphilus sp.]|nr:hypothetical protein [Terracidiphilus sp.]
MTPTGRFWVTPEDHVKSVDWKARRAEKLGHCTSDVIDEVRARLAPLLGY